MATQEEKLKSKVKKLESLYRDALQEKLALEAEVEELERRLENTSGAELNGNAQDGQHPEIEELRMQKQTLVEENDQLLQQVQASAQAVRTSEERLATLKGVHDKREDSHRLALKEREEEIQELKNKLDEATKELEAMKENVSAQVADEVKKRLNDAVVKETDELHQVIETSNADLRRKTEEIQKLKTEVESLKKDSANAILEATKKLKTEVESLAKDSANAILEATKKLKQEVLDKDCEIERLRKIILNAVFNGPGPGASSLNGAGPAVSSVNGDQQDRSTAVETVKQPHHHQRSASCEPGPSNGKPGKKPFNPNQQPKKNFHQKAHHSSSSGSMNQRPQNHNPGPKFKGKPAPTPLGACGPVPPSGIDSRNNHTYQKPQGPPGLMKQNGKQNEHKTSFDNLKDLQSRFSKNETAKSAGGSSSKESRNYSLLPRQRQTPTTTQAPSLNGNSENLLSMIQEASKFQSPSTTLSEVTETVEVERRPINRTEGLFRVNGVNKPPPIPPLMLNHPQYFTGGSQPAYGVNIGGGYKKIKEKQQHQQPSNNLPGSSNSSNFRQKSVPHGPPRNESKPTESRANGNSSKNSSPGRTIFVVKDATRKLNTIYPQGEACLLPVEAIPIHQIYHGSSKLSIDGYEFSVSFALTLMMESANTWVVNNLRICFPKLRDYSLKYGKCFVCLKFLDGAPGKAREKFVKTYTFCADDQYCSSAEKCHLNCPEATFVAEESNTFKLVGGKSSPEYPPPPIEIDLFLLTQEPKTDQHKSFADKRREAFAEYTRKKTALADESDDFKVQFVFSDSDVGEVDMLTFGLLCEYTRVFAAMLLESACNNDGPIINVASDFDKNTLKNLLKIVTCKSPVDDLEAKELLSLLEFSFKYFLPDIAQGCVDSLNNIFGK